MASTNIPGGKKNPAYYRLFYQIHRERYLKKNHDYYGKHSKDPEFLKRRRERQYRTMVISLLKERNGDTCGICMEVLSFEDTEVDHIIPISWGGLSNPDNLQLTHKKCNRAKGWKQRI